MFDVIALALLLCVVHLMDRAESALEQERIFAYEQYSRIAIALSVAVVCAKLGTYLL